METIYDNATNHSLVEIYNERGLFITRGRAILNEERALVKVFEKSLPLEFGEVFYINNCHHSIKAQLLDFNEEIIECFSLEKTTNNFKKSTYNLMEGVIKTEGTFQRDAWGSYIIEEPYYYATIISFDEKGGTLISNVEKNVGDTLYLFFEWQLFEIIVKCKIVKQESIDEYNRDYIYEISFLDLSNEMLELLSRINEV